MAPIKPTERLEMGLLRVAERAQVEAERVSSRRHATSTDYERITALHDSPAGGLAAIRARNIALAPPTPTSTARPAVKPQPRARRPVVAQPLRPRNESRGTALLAAIDRWYRDHPWAKTTTSARPPTEASL